MSTTSSGRSSTPSRPATHARSRSLSPRPTDSANCSATSNSASDKQTTSSTRSASSSATAPRAKTYAARPNDSSRSTRTADQIVAQCADNDPVAWVDRHAEQIRDLHALEDELSARDRYAERQLVVAAQIDPPEYITAVLGPRPESYVNRPAWERAVAAIETYRPPPRHRTRPRRQRARPRPRPHPSQPRLPRRRTRRPPSQSPPRTRARHPRTPTLAPDRPPERAAATRPQHRP